MKINAACKAHNKKNETVEALLTNTLASRQLYLWQPYLKPCFNSHANSVFLHCHKRTFMSGQLQLDTFHILKVSAYKSFDCSNWTKQLDTKMQPWNKQWPFPERTDIKYKQHWLNIACLMACKVGWLMVSMCGSGLCSLGLVSCNQ